MARAARDLANMVDMLGDFLQIPREHLDRLVDLAAPVLVQRRDRRRGGALQLVEQFDRGMLGGGGLWLWREGRRARTAWDAVMEEIKAAAARP